MQVNDPKKFHDLHMMLLTGSAKTVLQRRALPKGCNPMQSIRILIFCFDTLNDVEHEWKFIFIQVTSIYTTKWKLIHLSCILFEYCLKLYWIYIYIYILVQFAWKIIAAHLTMYNIHYQTGNANRWRKQGWSIVMNARTTNKNFYWRYQLLQNDVAATYTRPGATLGIISRRPVCSGTTSRTGI